MARVGRAAMIAAVMPELPEVETVARGLSPALVGRRIAQLQVRRADLRRPLPARFAERLMGQTVRAVRRRAKYILIDLANGETLIIHLGMSGRIAIQGRGRNAPPDKHDHVVFTTDDGTDIVFNDPRRFGLMDLARTDALADHALFAHLGPEPFDETVTGAWLYAQLRRRSGPIKTVIMDQELLVGVGNIYASEALYLARIGPRRAANRVTKAEAARLMAAIVQVLNEAIASGGSSLRNYRRTDGDLGYFQHHWRVYGRAGEPCADGAGQVKKITQAGRATYYCPHCQK